MQHSELLRLRERCDLLHCLRELGSIEDLLKLVYPAQCRFNFFYVGSKRAVMGVV